MVHFETGTRDRIQRLSERLLTVRDDSGRRELRDAWLARLEAARRERQARIHTSGVSQSPAMPRVNQI